MDKNKIMREISTNMLFPQLDAWISKILKMIENGALPNNEVLCTYAKNTLQKFKKEHIEPEMIVNMFELYFRVEKELLRYEEGCKYLKHAPHFGEAIQRILLWHQDTFLDYGNDVKTQVEKTNCSDDMYLQYENFRNLAQVVAILPKASAGWMAFNRNTSVHIEQNIDWADRVLLRLAGVFQ